MRIMLFAVSCLATLTLGMTDTTAIAQQRTAGSSSQRILPLPERELSDSQTQMELLKRLRSLVAGADDSSRDETVNSEDSPNSKSSPAIDEQQLEQLQQALKKLQDQLPPGIKPPELDSIPKEQLDQAMSNPAVQQQLKKMLEQFSKDGLLPKTEDAGNKSQIPPMPRPKGQLPKPVEPKSPLNPPSSLEPRFPAEPESESPQGSSGQQQSTTPDPNKPLPKPAEKSWQSLKDAMKKLAEIAQGQKKPTQNSQQNGEDAKSQDSPEMPDNLEATDKAETREAESSPNAQAKGLPGANRPRSNPDSPQVDSPQSGGSGLNKSSFPPSTRDNVPKSPNSNVPKSNPSETGEPKLADSEQKEQSLKTLQDLLERFKNSQRNEPTETDDQVNGSQDKKNNVASENGTRNDSMPPATDPASQQSQDQNSQNQNSSGAQSSPSYDPSKRILRRPDHSTPAVPPAGTQSRPSRQGEVFPPMPSSPRDVTPRSFPPERNPAQPPNVQPDQVAPRTEQPSPNTPESSSSGLFPSISEFIKEQMRDGFSIPTPEDGVTKTDTQPPKNRPSDMNPGASQAGGSGRGNSANRNPGTNGNARNGSAQSMPSQGDMNAPRRDLDVRKELENRGLRSTLEKIVQKAKEESRAKQQQQQEQEAVAGQPGVTPIPRGKTNDAESPLVDGARTPGDPGLQKSLGDLLSGLDDNLQDIAKDAKFNEPPTDNSRVPDSSPQSSTPKSDSSLGKIRDAASGFFSDLSKAPQAPAASPSSASKSDGGGSALAADAPFAIGSFFLVACVLIGVGSLVAYLMRKPLMKLVTDVTGATRVPPALQPNEIQSRADVIAAFHDLALSPRQAVESWWTHRAAAQTLAAGSPQSKQAVNTLAEIYEQARYLPDDVELAAEKIQSARTALAECR